MSIAEIKKVSRGYLFLINVMSAVAGINYRLAVANTDKQISTGFLDGEVVANLRASHATLFPVEEFTRNGRVSQLRNVIKDVDAIISRPNTSREARAVLTEIRRAATQGRQRIIEQRVKG